MRSLLAHVAIALLLVCVASSQCMAANTAFSVTLSGNHEQLAILSRTPAKARATFRAIRFEAAGIIGIGRARFVFKARKLPAAQAVIVNGGRSANDFNVPLLLKGYALLNRGASRGADLVKPVPVALAVIKGAVRLQFLSAVSNKQAKAARLYSLAWKLKGSADMQASVQARVSTKSNSSFLNKLCDTHVDASSKSLTVFSAARAAEPSKASSKARIVTLSTDADAEWYAVYRDSSNAEIAATINAAEAIFEKQLGVRFALVRQHVYVGASPYRATDSSALLASFAKNPENPANLGFSALTFDQDVDMKHLFTGKDLDGNVVGLSYVGAMCWSPRNAYGLTQNISRDMNITTFLHEVGHTFGASHDTADSGGIMYPSLGFRRYFSAVSIEQINRALAINGQCVSEGMVAANLANATLTLRQKPSRRASAVTLTGTLTSNLGVALPGEVVKLTLNERAVFVVTDATGSFAYRVKLSKFKVAHIKVFAQTANSETSILKPLKVQIRA
jgi:hypothetical protein